MEFILDSTLKPMDHQEKIKHNNYLEYLETCYAKHLGIVLKPQYVWQTILCEIADSIKDNPEFYRKFFTDSNDKKDISIPGEGDVINVDLLFSEIEKILPEKIIPLPEFTTETSQSVFAHKIAFLDAVSPYYNYSMYCCGFPKIRLDGTLEDWGWIINSILEMKGKFTIIDNYLSTVFHIILDICKCIEDNEYAIDFFKDIFYAKKCGSGSQTEVYGWFTKLFIKEPTVRFTENFSSHTAVIEYTNLSTNRKYKMACGLVDSDLLVCSDGFNYFIPEFSYITEEIKDEKKLIEYLSTFEKDRGDFVSYEYCKEFTHYAIKKGYIIDITGRHGSQAYMLAYFGKRITNKS